MVSEIRTHPDRGDGLKIRDFGGRPLHCRRSLTVTELITLGVYTCLQSLQLYFKQALNK